MEAFRRECADGLVLIYEWDSEYARALQGNLTEGFRARCKVDNKESSPPVRWFTYLRGLDGVLPDSDKSGSNAPRKDDDDQKKDLRAQLKDAPPEHAEGRSQFDYLRRLAGEIARLDGDKTFAKNGVKAIGIVGSDVYDKLLILQALRSRFRGQDIFHHRPRRALPARRPEELGAQPRGRVQLRPVTTSQAAAVDPTVS